jgi:Domain of unknown function (DUF5020)
MKKCACLLFVVITGLNAITQNLQLHYDFRHSIDPKLNAKNFPTLSFEYFKLIDTVGTGSFLLKMQADFNGKNGNIGQVFTQVSQSLRFWKPKVYLYLNYSGGLGVTPTVFGYYLANSYAVGISYPFQWKGAWLSANLSLRCNAFEKPSYDPQFTFYFGRGIANYRFFTAGSFVFWTENRNRGDDPTRTFKGKKFAFFGDPQFWMKIKNGLSVGTRVNVLYHLLTEENILKVYPTLGFKYEFR